MWADGTTEVLQSRHERKGLRQSDSKVPPGRWCWRCLWMPRRLNWWIGAVFAIGSLWFAVGSLLAMWPAMAEALGIGAKAVNWIFFAGSVPFTTAAYLQLHQAANAGRSGGKRLWFGWQPKEIGWLSCALQFVGTLLFNVNTFDATIEGLDWLQQDLAIWIPDVAGSVLFLASGYLAYAETCHGHLRWRVEGISWWVTFANLLGCVAFMVSACFAFVPPEMPAFDAGWWALFFTLLGAVGFLTGALLMWPETAEEGG